MIRLEFLWRTLFNLNMGQWLTCCSKSERQRTHCLMMIIITNILRSERCIIISLEHHLSYLKLKVGSVTIFCVYHIFNVILIFILTVAPFPWSVFSQPRSIFTISFLSRETSNPKAQRAASRRRSVTSGAASSASKVRWTTATWM